MCHTPYNIGNNNIVLARLRPAQRLHPRLGRDRAPLTLAPLYCDGVGRLELKGRQFGACLVEGGIFTPPVHKKRRWLEVVVIVIEPMNEARLSHLPFWGPSEGCFLINSTAVGLTRMKRFKGSGELLG